VRGARRCFYLLLIRAYKLRHVCAYCCRFGFKCETCAASAPCPHLLASAAALSRRHSFEEEFTKDTDPSEQREQFCLQGALQQGQPTSGSSVEILPAHLLAVGAETQVEENRNTQADMKHVHVWRSLCRRLLWVCAVKQDATAHTSKSDTTQSQQKSQQPQQQQEDHLPHISPERLVMHRHKHSCWLAAEGKVFDATLFLLRHPAGPEVILKYAGSDCSEDLILHSLSAQTLWRKYCIGVLAHGTFLGSAAGQLT